MVRARVKVRPANAGDRDIILEWRNDEDVRRQSFTMDVIPKEDHERWFAKVLASEDIVLLVAVGPRDERMGQIRFDLEGGEAVVNISLSKKFRGMGLSEDVLKAALKWLKKERDFDHVKALVKAQNGPSRKMFEGVGFKAEKEEDYKGARTVFYVLQRKDIA